MASVGDPVAATTRNGFYLDENGSVALERLCASVGLSKSGLAEIVGLSRDAVSKASRLGSARTQTRLREMAEIIARVSGWAGGDLQAMAWYRSQPLPEFGGRTAESLVKTGQAAAVRDYLDHVALGGFA